MSTQPQRVPDDTISSLWARAPWWRACVCVAALLSVAVVCFPPHWRTAHVEQAPAVPEAISYHATPQAVDTPPAAAAAASPVSTVASATPTPAALAGAVSQAPATTRKIAAAKPASVKTPVPAAAPTPVAVAASPGTQAPVNAQIALATPGGAATRDPSGLNSAFIGRTYHDSIHVDGYDLPLPKGEWAPLASGRIHMRGYVGTAYFLGRIEHKRLVGAIRVAAAHADPSQNAPPIRNLGGCVVGNPDLNYLFIDSSNAPGLGCWLINNYYTPPWSAWADRAMKIDGLDRRAAGDLAAKGVDYPQDFVMVHATRVEAWGLLEVSYLFDPELDGIKSAAVLSPHESEWHATNIGQFPEKLAYVARIRDWGQAFWPKFEQAFEAGKPVAAAAAPAS
ncbi:hypothetical protein [Burkholderia plantarii]|uniref:hypothetical protein n=1 Tax=Burkholderia plantarii TaxID=41899 RepID=UPI0018DE1B76|nr:hypothetical protein [Burkholderia plantarii]MBI0325886.1 hypothetical protein [Burkholderia plantarii]